MNRLQQKSWASNHIERVKDEILQTKFTVPEGWGPQELTLYIAHCFQKNKVEDLPEDRQEAYKEFINNLP